MSVTVKLHQLTVRRGGVTVVNAVDLSVGAGEWIGLIGPNGAGKSTVLEAIAGIVPAHGDVVVDGRSLDGSSARMRARKVALVPQQPVIPTGMSVIDYVMLGRTPYLGRFGSETAEDVIAANIAIADLGLGRFARRPVDALSGGERQRVVIARALAQTSPVLLLDEPTSALDVGHRMDVLDHIDSIRDSCGLTVISAVHDLTLAAQFCDRLVMLARGAVVAEGTASQVLTTETLSRHYGARVRIISDDDGIVVIPVRERDARQTNGAGTMASNV